MGFSHPLCAPFSSRIYFPSAGTPTRGPQKVSPQQPLSPGASSPGFLPAAPFHKADSGKGNTRSAPGSSRPPGKAGPGHSGQLSAGGGCGADGTEEPRNPAAEELGGNQQGWAMR